MEAMRRGKGMDFYIDRETRESIFLLALTALVTGSFLGLALLAARTIG